VTVSKESKQKIKGSRLRKADGFSFVKKFAKPVQILAFFKKRAYNKEK
jgi:hypothetical protein